MSSAALTSPILHNYHMQGQRAVDAAPRDAGRNARIASSHRKGSHITRN